MTDMRRLLPVVLLLVAGCSGSKAAPVASSTPSASPVSTAMTMAQARSTYLALAKPGNDALDKLRADLSAKPPNLAAVRADAAVVVSTSRVFEAAMLNTAWPEAVKATAGKVAEGVAAEVVAVRPFTTVKTQADLASEVMQFAQPVELTTQVELMRTQLGLPSAPG